jgi:hypothetical protein
VFSFYLIYEFHVRVLLAGCGAIMIDTLSKGQITHVGLVFGLIISVMIYNLDM